VASAPSIPTGSTSSSPDDEEVEVNESLLAQETHWKEREKR